MNFLAYRRGLAITAKSAFPRPDRLVLRNRSRGLSRLKAPMGGPSLGRGLPRRSSASTTVSTPIFPHRWPIPWPSPPTGGQGEPPVPCGPRSTGRCPSPAYLIGTQDILLIERPGRSSVEPVIKIRLKRTGHLAGRIVDRRPKPVSGQVVEIWSSGGGTSAAAGFGRFARRPALDDG